MSSTYILFNVKSFKYSSYNNSNVSRGLLLNELSSFNNLSRSEAKKRLRVKYLEPSKYNPFSRRYNKSSFVTSEVINKLLTNQGVHITQAELNKLKSIPGVKFTLPFNNQTYISFTSLVGKPKTRLRKAGVYIFTHKETGKKYVGSSNSLSRRLFQYFDNLYFNKGLSLIHISEPTRPY